MEALKGTYVWSRFETGDVTGRSEEWSTREGRFRSVADFNSFRRVTGYDGERGFILDENRKVRELTGPALETLRTESYLAANGAFFPERVKGRALYQGEGVVNGQLCHLLDLSAEAGRPVRMYLDANTFLPFAARQLEDADTIWTFYSNYRAVDGVQEPFELRTVVSGSTDATTFKVEAMQHLSEQPPAAFFATPPDTLRDFAFQSPGGPAEIPFELWDDHIIVFARSHGVGPLPFLVDTGAEASDLDASWAAQWKLPGEAPLEIQGTGGSQTAQLARLDTLALPELLLLGQRVVSLDLSGMRPAGRALAGVLGYDFLSRFVVKLDFTRHLMTLFDPDSQPGSGGEVVPFNLDSFVPRVNAFINDSIPAQFQVDTGSPATAVFFRPFWQAHALVSESAPQRTVETAGIGGRASSIQARFRSVQLGKLRTENPLGFFRQSEVGATRSRDDAGLLGMAFWKRFDVTLDYARRSMTLKPNATYSRPEECDMSGISLAAVADRVMISAVEIKSAAEAAGVKPGDFVLGSDQVIPALDRVDALERALKSGDGREVRLRLERAGKLFEAMIRLKKKL